MTAILEVLRCPVCVAELREAGGGLACTGCGREFPVVDGIPRLLDDSLPGMPEKRAEIAGWVDKAQAESWYERNDEVDAVLPYICRVLGIDDSDWRATEHSFSVLLDRYVEPGMRVLEVGAAKCWGAQHLIPRGCEYVGTDILADPNIGLGRGAFYEERAGAFVRVQADGEHSQEATKRSGHRRPDHGWAGRPHHGECDAVSWRVVPGLDRGRASARPL